MGFFKHSGQPQLTRAFAGWKQKITLAVRRESVVDGLLVTKDDRIEFRGMIQPLSLRQLALKPEGQRSFTWLQIHALASSLNLRPSDRILYNGKFYKVMAQNDYSLNGYIEYHAVYDYQEGRE